MTDRSGQCMCGAVRFSIRDAGHDYGACHCRMCQQWAGSALLALTVPADSITWDGSEHIARFQSSAWAERAWCSTCGSGLWYRMTLDTAPDDYEIPIGLLDDANGMTMTREIFIDKKPDAFAFAGARELLTEAQVMALYGITTEGA